MIRLVVIPCKKSTHPCNTVDRPIDKCIVYPTLTIIHHSIWSHRSHVHILLIHVHFPFDCAARRMRRHRMARMRWLLLSMLWLLLRRLLLWMLLRVRSQMVRSGERRAVRRCGAESCVLRGGGAAADRHRVQRLMRRGRMRRWRRRK